MPHQYTLWFVFSPREVPPAAHAWTSILPCSMPSKLDDWVAFMIEVIDLLQAIVDHGACFDSGSATHHLTL